MDSYQIKPLEIDLLCKTFTKIEEIMKKNEKKYKDVIINVLNINIGELNSQIHLFNKQIDKNNDLSIKKAENIFKSNDSKILLSVTNSIDEIMGDYLGKPLFVNMENDSLFTFMNDITDILENKYKEYANIILRETHRSSRYLITISIIWNFANN